MLRRQGTLLTSQVLTDHKGSYLYAKPDFQREIRIPIIMNWNMIISGFIIVVIKVAGMTVFLLYFSQIFGRNNESVMPTRSYGTGCPKDWDLHQGSCFFFSTSESSWNNSRDYCATRGSTLAVVDTPEKLKYLQDIANAEKYFVGLTRQPGGKRWRWINNSAFNGNVTNENQNFHCVTIGLTKTFDAASCDISYRWICERTSK
ncbi:C-type lectin domain family 5 member A isoform X1 [Chionomys nivalis]|uniref:C-type lectin domain family 5 member A isoform X1 n=1 Tax=Chionomys nivalis TaxID=269649 RepID=UPI00259648B8|nr:C-type lectin domain family 5 member A isoform X1 [Chionomys nivalis]